jgi:alpha-tubulin suppressor-like RCC1 family protein
LRLNADFLPKLSIRQFACGKNHSLLLSAEGFLYAMGSNEHGKLGVGRAFHELNFANAPVKVDTLGNVASVALGEEHSIALTRDFKVYGWG